MDKLANFLDEIDGMNDAEKIEYFIKYYIDRTIDNRKIILQMMLIKKAIQDGKMPMPTGDYRDGIVSDLKKLREEQIEIDDALKELYELKRLESV